MPRQDEGDDVGMGPQAVRAGKLRAFGQPGQERGYQHRRHPVSREAGFGQARLPRLPGGLGRPGWGGVERESFLNFTGRGVPRGVAAARPPGIIDWCPVGSPSLPRGYRFRGYLAVRVDTMETWQALTEEGDQVETL